ncbi:MAG: tetratricopeptide repeat protein [Acidobacteriota bacterium]
MNRDHLLSGAFGLLLGFIAGYVLHEVMAARQPPRLVVGQGVAQLAPPSMAIGGDDPSGQSAPQGVGAPPMAEIQRLREQVEKNPDDTDALLLLANLNFDIKSWQRAGELYQRYLKLKPESPDVLTDLGVTLREQGHPREALVQFERAAAMSPTHWQSRFNKVVVLGLDLRDFAAADKVLAELRKLQPDNASINELVTEIERRRNTPAAAPAVK